MAVYFLNNTALINENDNDGDKKYTSFSQYLFLRRASYGNMWKPKG